MELPPSCVTKHNSVFISCNLISEDANASAEEAHRFWWQEDLSQVLSLALGNSFHFGQAT